MSGYIESPLVTDPNELATEAIRYLMENVPGWVPAEASLEVWHIQTLARLVAEARDVASAVPKSIFRFYGKNLIGLAPIDDAPASVTTTWTMRDTQGYTVHEGTVAAFRTAGDELIPFVVTETFTVSPGVAATKPGQVVMRALEPGSFANGLGGTVGSTTSSIMEIVDALAFVDTISASSPSSGGVDAEDDETYLDRLHEELQLLTPRPILPRDFAILARRTPGVYRALAIGEYDPATDTYNNERTVAVAIVGRDGEVLGNDIRLAVTRHLESLREVNFVVHVMDPSYTVVGVTARIQSLPGYDPARVRLDAIAELRRVLDPGVWGGGDLTPPEWRATSNRVRYTEIAALLDRVPGVDYTDTASLRINGSSGDVILVGAAPLPRVGPLEITAF